MTVVTEHGGSVKKFEGDAALCVFGYAHVADEAGLAPGRHVNAWFERMRALPGFVADLEPYGDNARAGAGRSIYD